MTQQSAARAVAAQGHPSEVAALDGANAVMEGEALVQIGVVSPQQIERATVLAQHALEEELRLALKCLAQAVVVIGKLAWRRTGERHVAQEQPLPGEVLDEGVGASIRQHACDLCSEDGLVAQPPFLRQREQL